MSSFNQDEIWADESVADSVLEENDWRRMQEHFETSGYREGLDQYKNSSLQEGFIKGFEKVSTKYEGHRKFLEE